MTRGRSPGATLKPIRNVKLGDEVARQLRDSIMSGGYLSGEKLVVESLAERLGVSTMPVREALVALANEGILEVNPRRGFRVALLSRQDIDDIFHVQAFLAGTLAERAARAIDEQTLVRLRRIQEKVEALDAKPVTGKVRATIEYYNYSFHRTVHGVVDAPRLHWFFGAASQYVPRYVYETIPAWTQLTVHDHPGIIDALEKGDPRVAKARAEEHVLHAAKLLTENLEARGFWSGDSSDVHPSR